MTDTTSTRDHREHRPVGPPPPILYEQGPCLVIWKPPGILTQAPYGIDSLVVRLTDWLRRRNEHASDVYLGLPHRLDRPVSGAMCFALSRRAARRISEQFETRLVTKVYWACVEGTVTPEEGTWTDMLRKVHGEPRAEVVPADHPDARPAILHYRAIGQWSGGSLLEIELETGRTHQIRVQASSRGHAVLGDAQYGSTSGFGTRYDDERLRPIALHSRLLEFRHPTTQVMVSVTAPLSSDWAALGLGELDISHDLPCVMS